MRAHLFFGSMFLFLTGSTPGWQWTPEATDTRQYIRYDEEPGYCLGHCPAYFIYVFEDGEIVYHGEGAVRRRGLKKKKGTPALFQAILENLEENEFNSLAPTYWPEDEVCDGPYATDLGQFHLSVSLTSGFKKVTYGYGCPYSPAEDRVLGIRDNLQKIIPAANWVGRQHFNWDQQ